jgi:hypothetical protein
LWVAQSVKKEAELRSPLVKGRSIEEVCRIYKEDLLERGLEESDQRDTKLPELEPVVEYWAVEQVRQTPEELAFDPSKWLAELVRHRTTK